MTWRICYPSIILYLDLGYRYVLFQRCYLRYWNTWISNFLDLRNLQEQFQKALCYQKLFWPFTVWRNCSSDLKIFINSKLTSPSFKFLFIKITHGETYTNGILLPKLFWPTVRKNCSSDRKKLLKFEAKGREFAKFLRWLEKFLQTVKGQNNFW